MLTNFFSWSLLIPKNNDVLQKDLEGGRGSPGRAVARGKPSAVQELGCIHPATCSYLQLPLSLLCWVGGWQLPVSPPTLLKAVLCACACGLGEGQLCVSGKCSCTPPRQLPICYEALVTIPSLRGALLQFKCAPDREKTISGANNAAQMKNVLIFEAALWQKRWQWWTQCQLFFLKCHLSSMSFPCSGGMQA